MASIKKRVSRATTALRVWNYVLEALSCEWLLIRCKLPNGGGIILLRSICISTLVFCLAIGLQNLLDPTRTWDFCFAEFKLQAGQKLHWLGTFFAGSYAALYARFASQFGYLANVYNQIKSAEAKGDTNNPQAVVEWKAGFIEDASDLHLAYKPVFASVIHAWGKQPDVIAEFKQHAPGGAERLDRLMEGVDEVWSFSERRAKATTLLASTPKPEAEPSTHSSSAGSVTD